MTAFDRLKRMFGLSGGAGAGSDPSGGMISCDEAVARLFEYLDGELDDMSQEEVRLHLEVCKACYPRAQFERHFLEALGRSQRDGHTSEELKGRVLQALAEGGARGG